MINTFSWKFWEKMFLHLGSIFYNVSQLIAKTSALICSLLILFYVQSTLRAQNFSFLTFHKCSCLRLLECLSQEEKFTQKFTHEINAKERYTDFFDSTSISRSSKCVNTNTALNVWIRRLWMNNAFNIAKLFSGS